MNKKRIVSMLLALVMILGILPVITLSTSASIATSGPKVNLGGSADRWGKPDMYWETEEAILETPLTVEAVIKHPSQARNGGYIFANYPGDSSTPSITFGINKTGRPQVYIVDNEKKSHEFVFYGDAFPYAGPAVLTHMAFVIDPVAKTVSYYQNGTLIETKQGSWGTLPANMKYRIGTDFRPDGSKFFQGALNFVAVYDEPLSAEQIKASHDNATWTKCDSLIGAWDLTKQGDAACYDRSGNGNTLIYNQGEGVRIDTFGSYTIQQPLSGIPETVEAWIFMPASYTDRGGTLIGNYGAPGSCYFSYEIHYNGNPRCFFNNGDGTSGSYAFTTIDVRKSKWMHVAFVHDPANNQMHCYIDGVLTESVESTISFTSALTNQYCMFGGDRQGNGQTQKFVGYIKELRIYDDTRTAAEVASDYAGNVDYTDENIVLHYDLRNTPEYTNITDLTGNGNNVTYTQMFYGDVVPVEDYAYSIAVVGDTQTVAAGNAAKLKNIYQWIIDNKDDKKIQYVIGLGDITEHGEDWGHKNNDTPEETLVGDKEWAAALEAISLMDGKIPYSLIRGAGHDGVERFNEWFADHEGYTSQIDGYYQEGRIENVYHTMTIGNTDYLILCLDFGAKDPVLEWANEVVASHPAHRVIVTTHAYLEKDGSLLETGEEYCPSQSYYDPANNDGDDIWNKFVRKHPNICMVMSGHMTASDIVVSKQTGDYGNEITQILIDPQGLDTTSAPRGMVAMLYFSEDGKQVDAQYYSTITDMYRPNTDFTVSYGATEAPSYEDLSEDYLIVQDQETELYSVVENNYFQFLGGALRYVDATDGYANIRFGYKFDTAFDLANSNWKWNYGVVGSGLTNEKIGENKNSANRTNLVITNVPANYFADGLEVQMRFDVTIDGVTYTAIDRVRERSVLGVAISVVKSPLETAEAKAYAQTIVDTLTAG